MFTIRLFGQPELLSDGRPVTVARRKSRALLYYIAARRAPTPREHVIELLWPDLTRSAAQQTLRVTLYGLRKTLGPALITGDALALDPSVDVDLWELDDALAAPLDDPRPLARALERYRGPFLDGFTLPDAPEFDEWAAGVRERYHSAVVHGLASLARAYEERGDHRAGLEALERALALDPLREDVQREAMRLQYLTGDRVGAIRRYEQLRRRLDDELGVPPMAETQQVYDAIVTDTLLPAPRLARANGAGAPLGWAQPAHAGQRAGAARHAALLPFTGRSAELAAMAAAAEAGQLVLVMGEPGIGKTRLVEEFLQDAGGLVLVGAARELDHALPYQPVVEALRSLTGQCEWPELRSQLGLSPVWMVEVARLLPELMPSDTPAAPVAADESRLREGVSQLMRALARRGPVTFFIDDLQWADTATLGLLGYLVRQQLPGLTVVGATRPPELRSPLARLTHALMREGRLGQVQLSRLTLDETRQIARHLSAESAEELAEWLQRNGEGNPYIIAELVRYARDTGILRPDGSLELAAFSDAAPVVPPTIYSLIVSRLARLPEPARRVLDAATAVGREFASDVVAHVAALSEDAVLDALDELVAAGLVQPVEGGRYAFDHALTMEVASHEVGEARHRLLHRRVAEALVVLHGRQLDAVAGLIAAHFVAGGAPERAASFALRAGRRAASLAAWTEAISFYQQALAGIEDGERYDVLMALADAHLQSGQHQQAVEVLREAVEVARRRGDQRGEALARLAIGQALLLQGRFGELIANAQEVLASGDPQLSVRAELLWGAALSVEGSDLYGAAVHLRRAEELAAQRGIERQGAADVAHARFELGSVLAQQGDIEGAVAHYREALAIAAEGGEDAVKWYILAHNNLAYHLHLLGDPSALTYARMGLSVAQERGAISLQPYLLSTLGEIALAQNDLATAERHFSEGLALAERLAMPERIAGLGANLGLVALRRGQTALAIHRLSTAQARADALGTRHLAAQIRIWLAPLLPLPQARAVLAEARALAESGGRRRLLEEIAAAEQALERASS